MSKWANIKKASVKKAKSGFETSIYKIVAQARLVMLLDSHSIDDLILQFEEETAAAIHRKLLDASKSHPTQQKNWATSHFS